MSDFDAFVQLSANVSCSLSGATRNRRFEFLSNPQTFLRHFCRHRRSTRVAMSGHRPIWLLSAVFLVIVPAANCELTPPYFNLAEGRKIIASSTCGVDINEPELYCKLVGSHTDDQQNNTLFDYHDDHFHTEGLSRQGHVIQGQVRKIWEECGREFRRNSYLVITKTGSVNKFVDFLEILIAAVRRFECVFWPLASRAWHESKHDFRLDNWNCFSSYHTAMRLLLPRQSSSGIRDWWVREMVAVSIEISDVLSHLINRLFPKIAATFSWNEIQRSQLDDRLWTGEWQTTETILEFSELQTLSSSPCVRFICLLFFHQESSPRQRECFRHECVNYALHKKRLWASTSSVSRNIFRALLYRCMFLFCCIRSQCVSVEYVLIEDLFI